MKRKSFLGFFLTVFLVIGGSSGGKVVQAKRETIKEKQSEQLDDEGRVKLSWELNADRTEITFELWAETTGYVGFGISPQGGMTGADIFLAGVYPNGTAYYSDRYATGKATPLIDDHSDWVLLEANETETTTYLKFTRLLETCDEQDYPITNGTNRLIWALGQTDDIVYHGATSRGPRSVSLLGATIPEVDLGAPGIQTWNATLKMEMPHEDTAYWCSFHKGPLLTEKHHIVAFDAVIPDERAKQHTHHFIIYNCYLPSDGSMDEVFENSTVDKGINGELCYAPSHKLPVEYCPEYLYVWAKGGKKMVFPENIGYPIGDDGGKQRYYMLEIHYDNPEVETNITFETGVQFYYTNQLRQEEAGQLMIGHDVTLALTVPPNTPSFVTAGHCSPDCTAKHFPQQGIRIFNSLLHSHLSGRKLKVRHFRDGVELPWLDYDDHYDFDYQQNKPLADEVVVLPGDQLIYECTFDSTWTNGNVVIGGLSTREEMCEAFLWYYPRMDDLDVCGSTYPYLDGLEDLGITNYTFVESDAAQWPLWIIEPEYLQGDYEKSLSTKFNWTDEFKLEMETKRRFNPHESVCFSRINPTPPEGTVQYPSNFVEYVPEDACKALMRST